MESNLRVAGVSGYVLRAASVRPRPWTCITSDCVLTKAGIYTLQLQQIDGWTSIMEIDKTLDNHALGMTSSTLRLLTPDFCTVSRPCFHGRQRQPSLPVDNALITPRTRYFTQMSHTRPTDQTLPRTEATIGLPPWSIHPFVILCPHKPGVPMRTIPRA